MNYQISLDYDDFFKCSNMIKAEKIEVVGDSIWFNTDDESLKYLNDNNICYMLQKSKRGQAKAKVVRFSGIITALLIILSFLGLNFFRVSEIVFSGTYPINDEIEKFIAAENKKLLWFDFHPNNYVELSKKVRVAFKEYEWINIEKNGSKINVTIEATKSNNYQKDVLKPGNIVAKKDGVVSQFIAFDGKVVITDNEYVKAGDVLISGELSTARGYVLGVTYEEITIEVLKEIKAFSKTGNIESYYEFVLFNKSFAPFKKHNYAQKESDKVHKLTIPYLLVVNKIVEYEKCDIIYTYTEEDAVEYAKSLVEKAFLEGKVLPEEQILKQQLITCVEKEDAFEIKLMVKKEESLGEFKEFS